MDPRHTDALSGDHLLLNHSNDYCYCCHRDIPPKHVVYLMPCGCGPFHSSCIKRLKQDSLRPVDQEKYMSPVSIEFRCPSCAAEVQSQEFGPHASPSKLRYQSSSKAPVYRTPTPPHRYPYYQNPSHPTPHSNGMPGFSPTQGQSWPPPIIKLPPHLSTPSAPPKRKSGRRREGSGSILWSGSTRGSSVGSTISGTADDANIYIPDPPRELPPTPKPRVRTEPKRERSKPGGTGRRDTGVKEHGSMKGHDSRSKQRKAEKAVLESRRREGKSTDSSNINIIVHVCRKPGCEKCSRPTESKRKQRGNRIPSNAFHSGRRGTSRVQPKFI